MWKLHIIWTVNSREWYCGLDPLSRFLLVTLRRRAVAPISPEGDPCCCPTCVVGAFIGPPAPTPRPTIKHGTHVVKRNRNRYCYRSLADTGHWSNLLGGVTRSTLFHTPFSMARFFTRRALVARVTPIDFRPIDREIEWCRELVWNVYVAQMLSREKKKKKNPQLRRTVFLFKRTESEGREGE